MVAYPSRFVASLSHVTVAFGRHDASNGFSSTQVKTASTHVLKLLYVAVKYVLVAAVAAFEHAFIDFATAGSAIADCAPAERTALDTNSATARTRKTRGNDMSGGITERARSL